MKISNSVNDTDNIIVFFFVFQKFTWKYFNICVQDRNSFCIYYHSLWSSAFNDGFGSAAHVNKGRQEGKHDSQSWQDHSEKLVLVLHKLLFPFTFFTGIFFDFSFQLPHFLVFLPRFQTIICHYFDVYKHQVGFCSQSADVQAVWQLWILDARWRCVSSNAR